MSLTKRVQLIFFTILIILGTLYIYLIKIETSNPIRVLEDNRKFSFTINSKINQTINLHIATKDELYSISCNNNRNHFRYYSKGYEYKQQEEVKLEVKRGINHCQLKTIRTSRLRPIVKQKISFIDYLFLFIFFIPPIFHLLFKALIYTLNKLLRTKDIFGFIKKIEINFALVLLFIGIIIRFFYQEKYTVMLFQHDWHAHIEMIKYLADTWSIPLPGKGIEFPQQPLYYIITAEIYSLAISLNIKDNIALEYIGYFSFFCSVIFLIYGYKFISLLTTNKHVKTIAMIFLALTPSIVYLSARINNDSLLMALSSIAIYYIVKSYQSNFRSYFFIALLFSSLSFLTKISALSIELLFFALFIVSYKNSRISERILLEKRLYLFGLIGLFLLSYTLWRVYLPLDGSFHMVNSGVFNGQVLPPLDLYYFGTFNFPSLLKQSYSYVFGEDNVRHSFLTYQYGTMFFGEFNYTSFIDKIPSLKAIMQSILTLGLIFILGFVTFIWKIGKASTLEKLFFGTLLINFILILKFIFDFPSICNTDFRYFVPSFLFFSFIFGQGISQLYYNKLLSKIINTLLSIFVVVEIIFFILLIGN